MDELLVLDFDDLRIGLPLSGVERVIRAVYVTPLPGAPAVVSGVMNVHGRLVPVFNMRRRFRLPQREMALTDRLVIAHAGQRAVALTADSVSGVIRHAAPDRVDAETLLPGLEYVKGVVKLDDGLILIHDLARFLSLDEADALDRAMAEAADR